MTAAKKQSEGRVKATVRRVKDGGPVAAAEKVPDLTPEEAEYLIRSSPAFWFATCGHIRNKDRVDERPVPNVLQMRMSAAHEWQRRNGLPSRQIDLKIRQVGGTTMGAAILYHDLRNHAMRTVAIADVLDHSNNLFDMICYYADNDEFDWGSSCEHNLTEATFSNGSVVEKKTAERPSSTRSSTLQGLLASEVAWWPSTRAKSATETLLSLGNSLAKRPHTVGIKESTPAGAYGAFAEDWKDARWPEYDDYWKLYGVENEPGPGNGYIRVFAAWWEFSENEVPVGAQEMAALKAEDTTDEQRVDEERDKAFIVALMEKRGVTDAAEVENMVWRKLAWRRWCVRDADRCRGDLEKFRQEYPSDPVSCWLHSGKPRFNNEGLLRLERMAKGRRPEYGILDLQNDGSVVFRRTDPNEALIAVWEEPRIGCYYGNPIDPMTGKDQTAGAVDPDHNSVGVIRRGYRDGNGVEWNPMLVARVLAPNVMDATPLMDITSRLAKWYGNCLVIPEVNKGLHVVERCKDHNLNIYRRTVGVDKLRETLVDRVGWETNEQTRLQIIEDLADLIRKQAIDIYDPVMVGQLRTFVRNKEGRPEAAPHCHDDDVMMLAIGVHCMDSFTKLNEPKRRVPKNRRDDY